MPKRAILPVLVVTLLAPARPGGAEESLAIDHRPVKCIVAGKYPRLNACFAPSSRLARARVYFRVADGPPDWYYVNMKSDTPCFSGILPRPKKELIGRRVQYYLDAVDRAFAESRTTEADPLVVRSESECEDRLLAAPWLDKATVAVFPGMPAGFAGGGLGAGATAAIVGGGVAVVGGGVALIAGGSSSTSATTTTTTTTTSTTTTTTTTTTLTGEAPFLPSFKVFKGGVLQTADTITGTEPLPLVFDMCETSGPYPLRFNVEVDGAQQTSGCRSSITFNYSSLVPGTGDVAKGVRRSANKKYAVRMNIRSVAPNNDPKATRPLTVEVIPTDPCANDNQGPAVSLTKPSAGASYPSPNPFPVRFEAAADDASTGNNGIAFVEYKVNYAGAPQLVLGPITSGSPWAYDWTESAVAAYAACSQNLDVQAYAQDGCGNSTLTPKVTISTTVFGGCDVPPAAAGRSAATSTLLSELDLPGGSGQVVVNDEAAFPRAGRSALALRPLAGENRLEATLVEGRGPGTWRFDLQSVRGLQPESLRVIAGEAAQVGGGAVTFRLRGRPGERIVLSFRVDP